MCIFCKIIKGNIKSNIIYEDEDCIVIKDIEPKAKYHYLMITKKHYKLLSEQTENDEMILAHMFATIPKLSTKLCLQNGYRLIINQGDDAGQSVPHLHIHILGGEELSWNNLSVNKNK